MRRFAGIDLIIDRIPDETTILPFNHLLEKHCLHEQTFESFKDHLRVRGLKTRQVTIADIILNLQSPPVTSNNPPQYSLLDSRAI